MKQFSLCVVLGTLLLVGCAATKEELDMSTNSIKKDMTLSMAELTAQNAALQSQLDSIRVLLDESALVQKRMVAEMTLLANRVASEADRNDSRQEENRHRFDMLLGKSDKILAKKTVDNSSAYVQQPANDMDVAAAQRRTEAEAMFNAAKSDYHRGEYKLAYSGFKQVFEQVQTGDLAEEALYWMGLCLEDANQVSKAKVVYNKIVERFNGGLKACSALFKLASIYGEECDIALKKQYLQAILANQVCMKSGEFDQAAAYLQEILEYKPIDGKSQETVCRERKRYK